MKNLRTEVIKYAKMLNSKKLSVLRSGNISARYKNGFLITPSGTKYSSLKNKDIVFVSLKGEFDKKKGIPSSEWRFHQDIYIKKKDAKAIVHAHSNCATAISAHEKKFQLFIIWWPWLVVMILNVQNMLLMEQGIYLEISSKF